uniref:Small acidic protein-like domain-containing protein n=1 Tax=Denticeps clupeoides TaxID=299321 RepID=A0AAY4DTF3_9TELE
MQQGCHLNYFYTIYWQARRLALQEDIDKESQPKPSLGQWSTAQFDSPDQQQRFLRLMGGFKKEGSQAFSSSAGRPNMALGKEAQERLQQGLMEEFERAHKHRIKFQNQGAGLGFSLPSSKKFFIDVSACHSVKFED